MIFVDTGAWYSSFVAEDPDHAAANAWWKSNSERLVTTDYVVDELLTLLRVRKEAERAQELGQGLFSEELARIEWVRPEDVRRAWEIYQRFADKEWSFTDCVSRVVMGRIEVQAAFAFDQHFAQFGTVAVVP